MEENETVSDSGHLVGSFIFQIICQNITTMEPEEVTSRTPENVSPEDLKFQQKDALMYIIVVLGFYSFGVVLMVVKYLKEEKRDLEEEALLENFWRYKPVTAYEERGKLSGRLALNAFNAANLITQPHTPKGKITFV